MNEMSAQGCGCDPGCNWLCQDHAQAVAEAAYRREQEARNVEQIDDVDAGAGATPLPRLDDLLNNEDWLQANMPTAHEILVGPMVEEALRVIYPNGHKQYLPVVLKQLQLHSDKSGDYAAGGHVFGNFQRVAAILSNYPNLKLSDQRVVALVYALKQIDAVLWGINSNITHKVEGLAPRLDDIAVYATIVQCMDGEAAK